MRSVAIDTDKPFPPIHVKRGVRLAVRVRGLGDARVTERMTPDVEADALLELSDNPQHGPVDPLSAREIVAPDDYRTTAVLEQASIPAPNNVCPILCPSSM